MSIWSESDFDRAARELAIILREQQQLDDCNVCWSYHNGCLVRERTTICETTISFECNHTVQTFDNTRNVEDYMVDFSVDSDLAHSGGKDSILLSGNEANVKYWFFSITYDHVWQVPVLYFNIQLRDGTPLLGRSQVLKSLRSLCSDPDMIVDKADFISINEHPVTGLPSYFVHPCQTSSRLEIIGASSTSPLLRLWSWMAMILPLFGMTVPPDLFLEIQEKVSTS